MCDVVVGDGNEEEMFMYVYVCMQCVCVCVCVHSHWYADQGGCREGRMPEPVA